jgi:hypothetical protein
MNVESRIRELVQLHLADNHNTDIVRFADALLALAAEVGEIRCQMADTDALQFEVESQTPLVMPMGRVQTKLRMLCARLAVLATESGTLEGTLYGGTGIIPGNSTTIEMMQPNQWKVITNNTPSKQDFCILPGARSISRQASAVGRWTDSTPMPETGTTANH